MVKTRTGASRLAFLVLLTAGPILGAGCLAGDSDPLNNEDGDIGEIHQSLTKPTGVNGADDFCDSTDPAQRCAIGEGDCDKPTQCFQTGFTMRCGADNGAKWGFASNVDVCVPSHCTNGVQDGLETSIDCG